MLKRYPIQMNVCTGFLIAAIGDVAAQHYENQQKFSPESHQQPEIFEINVRRAIDLGMIRAVIIAPFISVWYPFLARRFPTNLLAKIALDQSVGSPVVISTVFLCSAILRGEGAESCARRLREDFFATWCFSLQYWPLVHMITFGGLIPVTHQPLFAHAVSVPWNSVMSYYANKAKKKTPLTAHYP